MGLAFMKDLAVTGFAGACRPFDDLIEGGLGHYIHAFKEKDRFLFPDPFFCFGKFKGSW